MVYLDCIKELYKEIDRIPDKWNISFRDEIDILNDINFGEKQSEVIGKKNFYITKYKFTWDDTTK